MLVHVAPGLMQEIDDPSDFKPSDWVDAAEIPDPKATKPDDWDEDAPATILDMSAEKPEVCHGSSASCFPTPSLPLGLALLLSTLSLSVLHLSLVCACVSGCTARPLEP